MLNAGATCSTRQGSTCEELLVDVGLCKAVASATAKKDFVKKTRKCVGRATNGLIRLRDKGAPQTN